MQKSPKRTGALPWMWFCQACQVGKSRGGKKHPFEKGFTFLQQCPKISILCHVAVHLRTYIRSDVTHLHNYKETTISKLTRQTSIKKFFVSLYSVDRFCDNFFSFLKNFECQIWNPVLTASTLRVKS